jgi:hypothetical protein
MSITLHLAMGEQGLSAYFNVLCHLRVSRHTLNTGKGESLTTAYVKSLNRPTDSLSEVRPMMSTSASNSAAACSNAFFTGPLAIHVVAEIPTSRALRPLNRITVAAHQELVG